MALVGASVGKAAPRDTPGAAKNRLILTTTTKINEEIKNGNTCIKSKLCNYRLLSLTTTSSPTHTPSHSLSHPRSNHDFCGESVSFALCTRKPSNCRPVKVRGAAAEVRGWARTNVGGRDIRVGVNAVEERNRIHVLVWTWIRRGSFFFPSEIFLRALIGR